MAKLGRPAGITIGSISVEGAEPLSSVKDVEVKLTTEVLPIEMAHFAQTGLETPLAAHSLLWSSPKIGAVVRDKEGLYHAVETNLPRLELGDRAKFAPAAKIKARFEFDELVLVPIVSYTGSSQPASRSNPCFVDMNARSSRPKTAAGQKLEQKIADAHSAWAKWHAGSVRHGRNPAPPPDEISLPFREILGDLLGISPTDVAVKQKKEQPISDKISIDLFDDGPRGRGGSTPGDIQERLDRNRKGDLNVILQLHPDAFGGPLPLLGILGTCIHEGAHYRHYILTRQTIAMWHKSSGKSEKSKPVTEDVFRRKFALFLDKLVRDKKISNLERLIVHSTFGAVQATHPFAQANAFIGVHPLYPREFDLAGSKKGRGLVAQPRYSQLLKCADAWQHAQNPTVADTTITSVAAYAKNQSDTCAETDLRELSKEVIALAGKKEFSANAGSFFQKLVAALDK